MTHFSVLTKMSLNVKAKHQNKKVNFFSYFVNFKLKVEELKH